jgi:hypothetical protein
MAARFCASEIPTETHLDATVPRNPLFEKNPVLQPCDLVVVKEFAERRNGIEIARAPRAMQINSIDLIGIVA